MSILRRVALALLVALFVVPVGMVGARAQTAPASTGTLRVVRQSDWVATDGAFSVEVAATGFPSGTVWSAAVWGALSNRAQLERAIDGTPSTWVMWSSPTTPLTGSTASITIPVRPTWPAPADGVVLTSEGVYPVVLTMSDASGRALGAVTTYLLRLADKASPSIPLTVAPVLTIGATPTVEVDGSATFTDDEVRSATERLTVTAAAATSMSIAPDAALTTAVVESASSNVRAAVSTAHELLARPWVELDTGALTDAGLTALWDREQRTGDDALADAFETRPERAVQPIDRATSPAALAHLAASGTRTVLVPSGMLDTTSTNTLTRPIAIRTSDGTLVNAIAADELAARRLLPGPDPVLAAHEALAALVLLHIDQPSTARGIAVVLPRTIDPTTLREFLRALGDPSAGTASAPVLSATTASGLAATMAGPVFGTSAPTIVRWTSDEPTSLGDYGARLATTDRALAGLHSMVPDDASITGPIDGQVLASAAAGLSDPDRASVLFGADRAIAAASRSVGLPPSQTMTLTSRTGRIPLNLRNDFPVDAKVRVRLVSPKLEFPEGSIIDTTLSPSGITRIDVSVATRASGSFPVDVIIESIDGTLPVDTGRITVRSTAISGLGIVLSVGAGLFLLAWWGSHFRKVRRARGLVDEPRSTPEA